MDARDYEQREHRRGEPSDVADAKVLRAAGQPGRTARLRPEARLRVADIASSSSVVKFPELARRFCRCDRCSTAVRSAIRKEPLFHRALDFLLVRFG